MNQPLYCKPDQKYFRHRAELIVRMAEVPESEVKEVLINCGGGGGLGWVVLIDGTRISV